MEGGGKAEAFYAVIRRQTAQQPSSGRSPSAAGRSQEGKKGGREREREGEGEGQQAIKVRQNASDDAAERRLADRISALPRSFAPEPEWTNAGVDMANGCVHLETLIFRCRSQSRWPYRETISSFIDYLSHDEMFSKPN